MLVVKSTGWERPGKWLVASLLLISSGCKDHKGVPAAGGDAAPVAVELLRLDQDLFRGVHEEPGSFNIRLQEKYGDIYTTYVEDVLRAAAIEDPRLPIALTRFVMDPDWSSVQARADSVFGDMTNERTLFNSAFTALVQHFPDSLVPRIVVFNSGFNYGILPADSLLGVGVEWFIGARHPVVERLAPEDFPQYMKERMEPRLLVPAAVKGWLLVHYTRDIQGADLLTNLVETGKVMALLDELLPTVDPAAKFAYTNDQLKWCEDNEFRIWQEVMGRDVLFSKRNDEIGRLMSDGPFTPGYPRESPGHLGEWLGYRIVRSYLKANPRTTFAELFAQSDPSVFLKTYKPR